MVSSCLIPHPGAFPGTNRQEAAKDQPLTPWPSPAWRSTDGNPTNHKDGNYGHMVLYIYIYIFDYIYIYIIYIYHIYIYIIYIYILYICIIWLLCGLHTHLCKNKR